MDGTSIGGLHNFQAAGELSLLKHLSLDEKLQELVQKTSHSPMGSYGRRLYLTAEQMGNIGISEFEAVLQNYNRLAFPELHIPYHIREKRRDSKFPLIFYNTDESSVGLIQIFLKRGYD